MKKVVLILVAALLLVSSMSYAEEEMYSVLLPVDDSKSIVLNIIKSQSKIIVLSYDIDTSSVGYSFYETDNELTIPMEDGIHKAKIVDGMFYYQLLPEGATIALSLAAPYNVNLSTIDGSFNIPKDNSKKSFSLPSGAYIAGEDFPAGIYRVELKDEKNSGTIRLYEKMDDVTKAFSYLYDYGLGSFYGSYAVGKIAIKEGNALQVKNTTVVLIPYEGILNE